MRLDSGDLGEHARKVRKILDEGGLSKTTIFASGGLDEEQIQDLVQSEALIDGFGIGTRLGTSADAPYLDCAYKLVEYEGKPRLKRSEGKELWPGRKQVYRRIENDIFVEDIVTLEDQPVGAQHVVPLLRQVMENGKRLDPPESLETIRERVAEQLSKLPEHLRQLKTEPAYPVTIAQALKDLAKKT